jgi:hypothetical protein
MMDEDDERDNKVDLRLQTMKLTMKNWNTGFKEGFKHLALNYGEAGDIIIRGRDIDLVRPIRTLRDFQVDQHGNPVRQQDGQLNFLQDRRYPDDDEGREAFIKDERRYYKLEDNKKKLISKLFMLMDREVTDKVTSSQGYEEAYARYDLLTLWNMLEQVVQGRGAVSIYALTTRLIAHKQVGEGYIR